MRKVLLLAVLLAFVGAGVFLYLRHRPRPQVVEHPRSEVTARPSPRQQLLGKRSKETGCEANRDMPDPACTPGAVFADVTAARVCVPHYTKAVRNVPYSLRKRVFDAYGIPMERASDYELDHHVSLELGGSNDIANLWPEAYTITDGARTKDVVENYLHRQVCKGVLTLQEAQYMIATDWKYYLVMLPPPQHRKNRTPRASRVSTVSGLLHLMG